MPWRGVLARSSWALVAVLLLAAAGGCRLTRSQVLMAQLPPEGPSPRELTKISLPTYVIEPPDVLLIDAVKVVPKPPYHIEPLDTLEIFVLGHPARSEHRRALSRSRPTVRSCSAPPTAPSRSRA